MPFQNGSIKPFKVSPMPSCVSLSLHTAQVLHLTRLVCVCLLCVLTVCVLSVLSVLSLCECVLSVCVRVETRCLLCWGVSDCNSDSYSDSGL